MKMSIDCPETYAGIGNRVTRIRRALVRLAYTSDTTRDRLLDLFRRALNSKRAGRSAPSTERLGRAVEGDVDAAVERGIPVDVWEGVFGGTPGERTARMLCSSLSYLYNQLFNGMYKDLRSMLNTHVRTKANYVTGYTNDDDLDQQLLIGAYQAISTYDYTGSSGATLKSRVILYFKRETSRKVQAAKAELKLAESGNKRAYAYEATVHAGEVEDYRREYLYSNTDTLTDPEAALLGAIKEGVSPSEWSLANGKSKQYGSAVYLRLEDKMVRRRKRHLNLAGAGS